MKFLYSMYDDNCTTPKTLGDWVKNFRLKKLQMKRKLRTGGDLRACAIMATALLSVENQLRHKQQERLSRCQQLQPKFHKKLDETATKATHTTTSTIEKPLSTSLCKFADVNVSNEDNFKRQRIEISNLWKDELNGLDEFMRKMSSSGNTFNNCGGESAFQFGESGEATRRPITVLT